MGIVCSTAEEAEQKKRNAVIDKEIQKHRDAELGNQKLLLLGTAECGKSTIQKQMRILHSNGFSPNELQMMAQVVNSNVVWGMDAILTAREQSMRPFVLPTSESDSQHIRSLISSGKDRMSLNGETKSALARLWSDNAIYATFVDREAYHLSDSYSYFMDNIDRIAEDRYVPTVEDVLYVRVPTTGVNEVSFDYKGCKFSVYDVGGQRSERRKWLHAFDQVSAIIFITAISEYDQVLTEDNTTNRLAESMMVFSEVCNNKHFVNSSMILFLNKKDLFEKKLRKKSIRSFFKTFEGEDKYDVAVDFIQNEFLKMNDHPHSREIFCHVTCATDTNQVQFVIDSVVNIVITKNMKGTGME